MEKDSDVTNTVQTKCTFFVEVLITLQIFFKRIRNKKEYSCAAGDLDDRKMERMPRKCFRCEYEDNLIEKILKPPK